MASPNLSEIVTTTIRSRTKKLADNVTENNALLQKLQMKGNIRRVDGGETIVQELDYDENQSFKNYSGYEVLDIRPSEVLTAAEFQWKQSAVAITISGREQMQNSGRERMIDLLRARIKNAERTFMNKLSEGIYSDGTGDGGKAITGLNAAIPSVNNTGTYGGINRASYDFWRNYSRTGAGAPAKATIGAIMDTAWVSVCRGTDKPDLVVCDNNTYTAFLGSLQDHQRFTNESKSAVRGFNSIRFISADVVLDGGVGGNAPSNTQFFINTNYMHWRPHRNRDMVPLSPDRYATNQDALVKLIGFMGNLTSSNSKLQGRVAYS